MVLHCFTIPELLVVNMDINNAQANAKLLFLCKEMSPTHLLDLKDNIFFVSTVVECLFTV